MAQTSARQARRCSTVAIVDDDEIIQRGVAAILNDEPQFAVCGVAGNEYAAVELLEHERPDLLLLDVSLGERDGLQFLKQIAQQFPTTRIVALAEFDDSFYAARALHAGAWAFVSKHVSAAELIAALNELDASANVAKGRRQKNPMRDQPPHGENIEGLTDRELHVFRLIGEGLGTGHIARALTLSRKTIESYRENIKHKLGYADAEALRRGALGWARHVEGDLPNGAKDRGKPR